MIEPFAFADIGIAHAAGVPWTEAITLIVTREPRPTVARQPARDRRECLVGYDRARRLAVARLPDWPRRRGAVRALDR